jgi:hypothetical protein
MPSRLRARGHFTFWVMGGMSRIAPEIYQSVAPMILLRTLGRWHTDRFENWRITWI